MAEQQRLALIFAADEYDHPDLQRLSAPVADANALAETLGGADLGGFAVQICHNLTSAAIAEKLEDFLIERKSGDLALLHFSGHGLKDESGGLYLAARNTIPTRLASTAIDATLINLLMRRSRARSIVLFLDCCYGGAFERGMVARAGGNVAVRDQFSQDALGGGRGRVVVTASSAVQYAFEGTHLTDQDRVMPSLFTGAVVEGIRSGDADRDADGLVSLGELYDYVYEKVLAQSPHQTPSKWEYGLEGDLIISKSPRRVVQPAALPDELIQIINHPYPVARRGAIDELARLAGGSDLPVAAAAVQALSAMVEDDSRSIALAATSAIDVLAIGVSKQALSFGELTVGAPAPDLSCELLGPPLVEAAEVSAEPEMFEARLAGRTIHLSAQPAEVGEWAGMLSVRSAVGDVAVPLTCSVLPVDIPAVEPMLAPLADPAAVPTKLTSDIATDDTGAFGQPQVHPEPDALIAVHQQPESTNTTRPAALEAVHTGPNVIGPMVAIFGAVLIVAGFFAPWSTGAFLPNSLYADATNPFIILLLPSISVVVGSCILVVRRDEGLAFGAVGGGFLTSLTLFLVFVAVLIDNPDSSWKNGGFIELIGLLLLATGGFAIVRGSAALSTAVTASRDARSIAGLVIVIAGVVIAIVDLSVYAESVDLWMIVFPALLAVVAIPLPLCRFGVQQASAAVGTVIVFVILWVADTLSNMATGFFSFVSDTYWWIMILAGVVVAAGCAVGQLPRRPPPAVDSPVAAS